MIEYRKAEVAQLAERLYRKQQAAGPIPAFGSTLPTYLNTLHHRQTGRALTQNSNSDWIGEGD